MKKALCIGINNYPGISNDLKGCVNDANDWAELLEFANFQIETIFRRKRDKTKYSECVGCSDFKCNSW